ncbi:MAG: hypothetical protein RL662_1251 [Bacteroidota bacterium]|jgi:hypothetical protein
MKNIIYTLLSICLLFSSCSSEAPLVDDAPVTSNKLYKAVFKLGELNLQVEESNMRSSTLSEAKIQHLEYWIHKTADINNASYYPDPLEHALISVDSMSQNITIELPVGDYTIAFLAADMKLDTTNFRKRNVDAVAPVDYKTQLFGKNLPFKITDANKGVSAVVQLERLVGKVELVIEDLNQLPNDVQAIIPVLSGLSPIMGNSLMGLVPSYSNIIYRRFYWGEGGSKSYFPVIPRSQFATITKDNPIVFYSIPSEYPRNGSVGAFGEYLYIQGAKDDKYHYLRGDLPLMGQDPSVLFMRKVGKYNVKTNQTTRYTGKIQGASGNGISITEQQAWDEQIVQIPK